MAKKNIDIFTIAGIGILGYYFLSKNKKVQETVKNVFDQQDISERPINTGSRVVIRETELVDPELAPRPRTYRDPAAGRRGTNIIQ